MGTPIDTFCSIEGCNNDRDSLPPLFIAARVPQAVVPDELLEVELFPCSEHRSAITMVNLWPSALAG